MDTPDREARSLAHFIKQRKNPSTGKAETQVTVIAKDRTGTEHPTGWAAGILEAFETAGDYIKKHLPGYTL